MPPMDAAALFGVKLPTSDTNEKSREGERLEVNGKWRNRIEIDNKTENNSSRNIVCLSPGVSRTTYGWVISALAG